MGRDQRAPEQRIVVTGRGVVTPLGGDLEATWTAAEAGRSGIGDLTRFDPTGLPCRIAGEVEEDWIGAVAPPEIEAGGGGRPYRLLLAAALQAASEAGLSAVEDRTRVAVVIGGHASTPALSQADSLVRLMDEHGALDLQALGPDTGFDPRVFTLRRCEVTPSLLADALDARGAVLPIVSACAAGAQAVGEGVRLLRDGGADVVVAGGTESQLNFVGFAGFALLGALARRYRSPETASRPFDRRRSGFVMSEGAGVLTLETLARARARGAAVWGEILGYGDSADGFRITDMHPKGDGATRAMRRALDDARRTPDDVDAVNAHGTSTAVNDPVETHAIKRVLGERAYDVPTSSNKSMIGHTIGAAGAIEAILALEGIRRGVILPTINQETPDRKCDLDYVPNEARVQDHAVVLSNSFGFGGQNACLCLGRRPDDAETA